MDRWHEEDASRTRSRHAPPEQLLADPKIARWLPPASLGRGELKPAERDHLLAAAAKLPVRPGARSVRGLPTGGREGRSQARLESRGRGPSWPSQGDAGRGEKAVLVAGGQLRQLPQDRRPGHGIGPDLSTIGKLRPREDLLESILEPSRRIEPKYAAYVAYLADGRSFTGLLVKRDEKRSCCATARTRRSFLSQRSWRKCGHCECR